MYRKDEVIVFLMIQTIEKIFEYSHSFKNAEEFVNDGKLLDAVYMRRGWTSNGIPKIDYMKKIGMDLPEILEIIAPFQ